MAPPIPWYFDALLKADCAEMQTGKQSRPTPSLHHFCYHINSSHHHFLPWTMTLFSPHQSPPSALVPLLSHSPPSSKSESFRTSQIMPWNPPVISHFPENGITHLWISAASSQIIFTFTPRIQNPVFFQFQIMLAAFH